MPSVRLLAAILSLVSCGPQDPDEPSDAGPRFASAVCESSESCGCATPFSDGECEDLYLARFALLEHDATVMDECFEPLLDALAMDPCGVEIQSAETICVSLRGSKGVGESCSYHAELPFVDVNECDEDLTCGSAGRCVEPDAGLPPFLQEGDACRPDFFSCGNLDLFCAVDGTCHPLAAPGEECEPYGCQRPDIYCAGAGVDQTGTCTARVALGGDCNPLDDIPCYIDGELRTHCDPATNTCVEGVTPLCAAINEPLAWR